MPRTARLRLPDVPLHILQRGHNRSPCFIDTKDYELYLGLLEEFSLLHACPVHAYVLMTNHIHLLATPQRPESASEMMRSVNQRYVQHVNRKWKRSGSLWEGRFRSSLVDSESYFFTCQRYIELNPVRAQMTAFPGQHPWSSYRANAEGFPTSLVVEHSLYAGLGADAAARRRNYRAMFDRPLSPVQLEAIRGAIRSNRPLGSEAFAKAMTSIFGKRAETPSMGRPRGSPGKNEQAPLFQEK